jgi:hypothetical protein
MVACISANVARPGVCRSIRDIEISSMAVELHSRERAKRRAVTEGEKDCVTVDSSESHANEGATSTST